MVKKPKQLTPEYLSELKLQFEATRDSLLKARTALFDLTPIAKLGNPEFEAWRIKCTDLTRDYLKLEKEIEATEKYLGR